MGWLAIGLLLLVVVTAGYWLEALRCTAAFRRRTLETSTFAPRITILKPLCGAGGHLYESLRSFCEQDYPEYQIVVGVRDADDPAVKVVSRLLSEFPRVDVRLVVNDRLLGTNPKVSNLANLYETAKYDVLLIADSDIRVDRDYLRAVVAPLGDARVGLVSCLYRGIPDRNLWATLGAMFINEWFFPSALVGARLGGVAHAFGATMVFRRDMLEKIGGFAAIADDLADDYRLGQLINQEGGHVVITRYVVDTAVTAATFRDLFLRELRWARTYRTLRPIGYFFSVVTLGLPIGLLGLLATWRSTVTVAAVAVLLAIRLVSSVAFSRALGLSPTRRGLWLVPVRDTLSLAIWALSFVGRTVYWGGRRFRVDREGKLTRADRSARGLALAAKEMR